MSFQSMMACERARTRFSTRDSLMGAGAMIAATLLFSILGIAARRNGWPVTGEILKDVGFLGAFVLSTPFWLMKGQPWKAQAVIVGATLAFLVGIGYIATIV
jgi:hypothetical protein